MTNQDEKKDKKQEESIFRKAAMEKYMHPNQLDKLLVMVNPKAWIALFIVAAIVALIVLWAFMSTLPIMVAGRAIVMPPAGLLSLQADKEGTIIGFNVKTGDQIAKGQVIATLTSASGAPLNLTSYFAGKVIHMTVKPGTYIRPGTNLMELDTSQSNKVNLETYFLPTEMSRIFPGEKFYLNCFNGKQLYKGLLGQMIEVHPLPVVAAELKQNINDPQAVNFISQNAPELIQANIEIIPSDSPMPPTDSLCIVETIIGKHPINYVLG